MARDVTKGGVGKNCIRSDTPNVSNAFAQRKQTVEKDFVAFDFTGAFRGFFEVRFFGEENFAAIFERGAAFVGEFDDVHSRRILKEETEADEFAADGFPLFGRDVFADGVGGEFVVAVFQNSGGA